MGAALAEPAGVGVYCGVADRAEFVVQFAGKEVAGLELEVSLLEFPKTVD